MAIKKQDACQEDFSFYFRVLYENYSRLRRQDNDGGKDFRRAAGYCGEFLRPESGRSRRSGLIA
jgi:hypothetical protein